MPNQSTFWHTIQKTFTVQVKTVGIRNAFPIAHDWVEPHHTYVFAILNKPGVAVPYFIVPGLLLANEPERFTKGFVDPKFLGIPLGAFGTIRGRLGCISEAGLGAILPF